MPQKSAAKKPARTRANPLLIYLDDFEDQLFRSCAEAAGLSPANWIRTRLRAVGIREQKNSRNSENS